MNPYKELKYTNNYSNKKPRLKTGGKFLFSRPNKNKRFVLSRLKKKHLPVPVAGSRIQERKTASIYRRIICTFQIYKQFSIFASMSTKEFNPIMKATGFIYLVIIVLCILLASCVTESKCSKRYPCVTNQITKDSTGKPKVTQTPFDTAAWIREHKGKPIYVTGPCPDLDSAIAANNGTLTTIQDGVRTTITGGNGKPRKIMCETDSLKEVIRLMKTQIETPHFKEITREIKPDCQECAKDHEHWYETMFKYIGMIATGLGALWVFRRVK